MNTLLIMNVHNLKFDLDMECIVYLENYYKNKQGSIDAFIDFRSRDDLMFFNSYTQNELTDATFIKLHSLKSSKLLKRGCYYKLNLTLLSKFQLERTEDSLIIGGAYNLAEMPVPDSEESDILQKHKKLFPYYDYWNIKLADKVNVLDKLSNNDLQLYVKDVGQANWNELRSGTMIIVLFDAGAELIANKNEVSKIFNSRKADLMISRPILVISHWDIDHIHCLKSLTIQDIKDCFSCIICNDQLKTITSKRILCTCYKALNNKVYILQSPPKTNGIKMTQWISNGFISLYLGEINSNRNYSGLLMFVRGNNKSANYTGDCRLSQAKDAYDQEKIKGLNTNEHILIAPHHGGYFSKKHRVYSIPCNEVEISVGDYNICHHPNKEMVDYLNMLSLGNVEQTNNKGDIIKDLD